MELVTRKASIVLLITQLEKNELNSPKNKSSMDFDSKEDKFRSRLMRKVTISNRINQCLSKEAMKARAYNFGNTTINIIGDTKTMFLQFSCCISPVAIGIFK